MQPPVCYQFTQRGFCSYGSNCRFLHAAVGATWGHAAEARTVGSQPPGRRAPIHVFEKQQTSYYFRSETQVSVSAVAGYRGSHGSTGPSHERSWTSAGGEQGIQTVKNERVNRAAGSRALDFRVMSWNILAAELVRGSIASARSVTCILGSSGRHSYRLVCAWVGQVGVVRKGCGPGRELAWVSRRTRPASLHLVLQVFTVGICTSLIPSLVCTHAKNSIWAH